MPWGRHISDIRTRQAEAARARAAEAQRAVLRMRQADELRRRRRENALRALIVFSAALIGIAILVVRSLCQ